MKKRIKSTKFIQKCLLHYLKFPRKFGKDKETSKSLDKLEEQLRNGEFHAGRGAEKLPGTKNVYYMQAGNKTRSFFRCSEEEKEAIEKLA